MIALLFVSHRQRVFTKTLILASVTQLLITGIILAIHIYILCYARRKLHAFEESSLQRQQTSLRLTRTTFYILLCQVILSLPEPIINFMYLEHWGNPEVERKQHYWARALVFSNSIANALILLQGQNGKKR